MKTSVKIFKLICNEFGHKFSFHAHDMEEAISKKGGWCYYHRFHPADFQVEETTEEKWMHDEYVNDL